MVRRKYGRRRKNNTVVFRRPNYKVGEALVDDWTKLVYFALGIAVGAGLLPPRVELSNGRVVEFNLETGEDKYE